MTERRAPGDRVDERMTSQLDQRTPTPRPRHRRGQTVSPTRRASRPRNGGRRATTATRTSTITVSTCLRQAIGLEPSTGSSFTYARRRCCCSHRQAKTRARRPTGGSASPTRGEAATITKRWPTALRLPNDIVVGRVRGGAVPPVPRRRRGRVDRFGGPPVRPRRRAPAHPPARADQGRLHDAESREGGSGLLVSTTTSSGASVS